MSKKVNLAYLRKNSRHDAFKHKLPNLSITHQNNSRYENNNLNQTDNLIRPIQFKKNNKERIIFNNNEERKEELSRSQSIYSSTKKKEDPHISLDLLPAILECYNNQIKKSKNDLIYENRRKSTTIAYLKNKLSTQKQVPSIKEDAIKTLNHENFNKNAQEEKYKNLLKELSELESKIKPLNDDNINLKDLNSNQELEKDRYMKEMNGLRDQMENLLKEKNSLLNELSKLKEQKQNPKPDHFIIQPDKPMILHRKGIQFQMENPKDIIDIRKKDPNHGYDKFKILNLNKDVDIKNNKPNILSKLEEDNNILRKKIEEIVKNNHNNLQKERIQVIQIAEEKILKGMKKIEKSLEESKLNSKPIDTLKEKIKNLNIDVETLKISQKSKINSFQKKYREMKNQKEADIEKLEENLKNKYIEMKNQKKAIQKLDDKVNYFSSINPIRKSIINNLIKENIDIDTLKKNLKKIEPEIIDHDLASEFLSKYPFKIEDKGNLKNIIQHIFSNDDKEFNETVESLPSKEFKKRIIILIGYYEIPREKSDWEKLFKKVFKKLKELNKLHDNANDSISNDSDNKIFMDDNKNADEVNNELKDFFRHVLEKAELNSLLEKLEEFANAIKGKKQIHLLNIGRVLDDLNIPIINNLELIEKLLIELKANLEGFINFKPLEKKIIDFNYHIIISRLDDKESETISSLLKILEKHEMDLLSILLDLIEYLPNKNQDNEKKVMAIKIDQLTKVIIDLLRNNNRSSGITDFSFLSELLKKMQKNVSKNKIDESYIELEILESFFDLFSSLTKKGKIYPRDPSDDKKSEVSKNDGKKGDYKRQLISVNNENLNIGGKKQLESKNKNSNTNILKEESNGVKEEEKKDSDNKYIGEGKNENDDNKGDNNKGNEQSNAYNDFTQVIDYIIKSLHISLTSKDKATDFVYDKEAYPQPNAIPFINFFKSDLNIENIINLLQKLKKEKSDLSLSLLELIIEYFSEMEDPKCGLIQEILSGNGQFENKFKGSNFDSFITKNSLKYVRPFKLDSLTIFRAISQTFIEDKIRNNNLKEILDILKELNNNEGSKFLIQKDLSLLTKFFDQFSLLDNDDLMVAFSLLSLISKEFNLSFIKLIQTTISNYLLSEIPKPDEIILIIEKYLIKYPSIEYIIDKEIFGNENLSLDWYLLLLCSSYALKVKINYFNFASQGNNSSNNVFNQGESSGEFPLFVVIEGNLYIYYTSSFKFSYKEYHIFENFYKSVEKYWIIHSKEHKRKRHWTFNLCPSCLGRNGGNITIVTRSTILKYFEIIRRNIIKIKIEEKRKDVFIFQLSKDFHKYPSNPHKITFLLKSNYKEEVFRIEIDETFTIYELKLYLASKFYIDKSLIVIYSSSRPLKDDEKIKLIVVEVDQVLEHNPQLKLVPLSSLEIIQHFKIEQLKVGGGCLSLPFSRTNDGL